MATQPGCEPAKLSLVSRIKQSANAAGISTVRDMALQSGVSKSGVDKIYRLNSFPTFDTLLAMANACGCTVHDWTQDLEQPAKDRGKRPEKPEPAPQPTPKPDKAEPLPPLDDNGQPQPLPATPPPEPPKDSGKKVDLMAMLHGMKPTE